MTPEVDTPRRHPRANFPSWPEHPIAHSQAGYTSAVIPITEKQCWQYRRSPYTTYGPACRTVRGPRKGSALLRARVERIACLRRSAPCARTRHRAIPQSRTGCAPTRKMQRSGFCAQERAAFPGSPISGGERWTDQPAGARAGSARVRCRHTDVPSANPGQRSRTQRAGARWAPLLGCLFSWLLLFGQAKRSDSPAGMRAKPRRDASRFHQKLMLRKA